jgi:hypothetical protein
VGSCANDCVQGPCFLVVHLDRLVRDKYGHFDTNVLLSESQEEITPPHFGHFGPCNLDPCFLVMLSLREDFMLRRQKYSSGGIKVLLFSRNLLGRGLLVLQVACSSICITRHGGMGAKEYS